MSYTDRTLPFPRGETYNESGLLTLTNYSYWSHLEGQRFKVPDTVHSTGADVELIVLRNGSGSAITSEARLLKFGTAALNFGRVAGGFNNVAGGVAVPLDDAYTASKSIASNDLFYAVLSGPCNVKTEASSVNLAQGAAVASDASGYINGAAAAAGETVIGVIDQASTTVAESVVVHIINPLKKSEAAG